MPITSDSPTRRAVEHRRPHSLAVMVFPHTVQTIGLRWSTVQKCPLARQSALMVRWLLAAMLVASLAPAAAGAARPASGASYLVRHQSFDRDNLLNINADSTAFADSASAIFPGAEGGVPAYSGTAPSQFNVDSRCRNGYENYTPYLLNGVRVRADGSFSGHIRDAPRGTSSGPETFRAEFRLHGRFDTPTTVRGWFSEVRYLRVRRSRAPAGTAAVKRRITWCHTGTRAKRYRITFTGRLRPIQWIIDNTCIACT